jgi:adenine-specific DNA-methyltransferase
MASELDVLLDKVEDPALRADLRRQVGLLRAKRRFGLVFEEHLPERVQLPEHTVRRGTRVVLRDDGDQEPREVLKVAKGMATVRAVDGGTETVPVADLLVVADFGEPIYPGLRRLGSLNAGGDKPAHVVIKGENHHVLEALQFTHAGKVDCIYIDPPYNTGARDWKYGNDYVDADDRYRHSKWLAFMERRLRLAKQLLNPDDSALIVTIDEKEYLRLGLLLEQVFPGVRAQMVSSVINPAGTGRQNEFSRTNEYIFFLQLGGLVIQPMLPRESSDVPVEWEPFRRRDLESRRGTSKGGRSQFYPVYVDRSTSRIVGTGEPLPHDQERQTAPTRDGCASVFPVREDGTEMNWALTREEFERRLAKGYVRVGRHQPKGPQEYVISYLRTGPIADIEAGRAVVVGKNPDGSLIARYPEGKRRMPLTQWEFASHDAQRYGTTLLQSFIPGRRFPFPKSLYAVEDTLRIAVGHKPEAVVLDYFGGSGTTAHAVARLNRQDGGSRQCLLVTNNEVSEAEARSLTKRGHRRGDPAWEELGIFEHVTRPRIEAAITGVTTEGEPIRGDYRFNDEFPMSTGLGENVEFLELTYLDPEDVEISAAFEGIAPLLWLRAGGRGEMIEHDAPYYAVMETYGVLFNPDRWRKFVSDLHDDVRTVFIVTDSPSIFAAIASELPAGVEAVRLYENYLSTFTLNTRRTVPVAELAE